MSHWNEPVGTCVTSSSADQRWCLVLDPALHVFLRLMRKGRQRAFFVVAALSSGACQVALDIDRFDFEEGDAGPRGVQSGSTPAGTTSSGNVPSGSTPSGGASTPASGDGQAAPVRGSDPASTQPSPAPDGNASETAPDSGSEPPMEAAPYQPAPTNPAPTDPVPTDPAPSDPAPTDPGTPQPPDTFPPVTQPPPPPSPRPVLVNNTLVDSGYAGAQEGAERRGICTGGSVMVGVSFYFEPQGAGERLGFVAPVCARFGDDPNAPLQWTRDDAAVFWPLGDGLEGDPPPPFTYHLLSELVCPAPLVLAGALGNMDPNAPTYIIRDVVIECAPVFEVAGSRQVIVDRGGSNFYATSLLPFSGAEQYAIGCDNGNVAAGVLASSGAWLDGFALSCTSLSRPRVAGDGCFSGDACQSGVCDGSGRCTAP